MLVQYDVSFAGGVTREAVAESARLFERIVAQFDKKMNSSN